MTRLYPAFLLATILSVASCSGPGPTTPESPSTVAQLQYKEAPGSESKSDLNADHVLDAPPWINWNLINKKALTHRTFQNAYKLEHAVWCYAEDNGGNIPGHLSEPNLAGKYLVDYLPGQQQFINPFTQARTEPRAMRAATPGEVGYDIFTDIFGRLIAYFITAEGWEDQRIEIIRGVTNLPYSDAPILR